MNIKSIDKDTFEIKLNDENDLLDNALLYIIHGFFKQENKPVEELNILDLAAVSLRMERGKEYLEEYCNMIDSLIYKTKDKYEKSDITTIETHESKQTTTPLGKSKLNDIEDWVNRVGFKFESK